jgi:hypothetical protein
MSLELAHSALIEDLVDDPDRDRDAGGVFSYPRFAQYVRRSRLDLSDYAGFSDFEVELSEITDLIQRTTGGKRQTTAARIDAGRTPFVALETTAPTERAKVLAALLSEDAPGRRWAGRRLLATAVLVGLLSLTNADLLRIVDFARMLGEQFASLFG